MSTTNSIDEKLGKADDQVDHKQEVDAEFNPKSLKFLTVMIGMYMSIFLVALVRPFQPPWASQAAPTNMLRTGQSSPSPSLHSPTPSTPSATSAGTDPLTC